MDGLTPIWVPLAVAAVGFGGVMFTQVWSKRREDERWRREREVERQRWERERVARFEQWQREDKARWLAEKRQAYADMLGSLDRWHNLLIRAEEMLAGGNQIPEAMRRSLGSVALEYENLQQQVQLVAPKHVLFLTVMTWMEVTKVHSAVVNQGVRSGVHSGHLLDEIWKLRGAIRHELGIDEDLETHTKLLEAVVAAHMERAQVIDNGRSPSTKNQR